MVCWWVLGWMAWVFPILKEEKEGKTEKTIKIERGTFQQVVPIKFCKQELSMTKIQTHSVSSVLD